MVRVVVVVVVTAGAEWADQRQVVVRRAADVDVRFGVQRRRDAHQTTAAHRVLETSL